MKIQLVWLMVVIFTLFSNGYAELSFDDENKDMKQLFDTIVATVPEPKGSKDEPL